MSCHVMSCHGDQLHIASFNRLLVAAVILTAQTMFAQSPYCYFNFYKELKFIISPIQIKYRQGHSRLRISVDP